jgi:hypothetical protein
MKKERNIEGNIAMRFFGWKTSDFQKMLGDIKNQVKVLLNRNTPGGLNPDAILAANEILATFKTGGPHTGEPNSMKDSCFVLHWDHHYAMNSAGFSMRHT